MAKTKGAVTGARPGAMRAIPDGAPARRGSRPGTGRAPSKARAARAAGKPAAARASHRSTAKPASTAAAAAPPAARASSKSTAKPASTGAAAAPPAARASGTATAKPDASIAPGEPAIATGTPATELLASRDIARLLRYGERIGGDKIDVRMLPLQFHARSGALAVCDPGRPETWHVLERPIGTGAFRVMLSIARPDDDGAASGERLAAVVIHVGRPPIARWTVAQLRGDAGPVSREALPRTPVTGGWLALLDAGDGSPGVIALPPPAGVLPIEVPLTDGRRALALPCGNGAFTAYWALDADDRPICVVVDFDAFTAKAWRARAAVQ